MGAHAADPAQAHGGLLVLRVWNLGAGYAPGEDLGAQQAQHGGDKGIGHKHGDDHGARGGDGHGGQEWDADNGQGC